jgi:hypothetical protein
MAVNQFAINYHRIQSSLKIIQDLVTKIFNAG